MITIEESVAQLHGSQYRSEGSKELFEQMQEAGLVAVFGVGNDLMEFRGAINAVFPSQLYVPINKNGVIENKCENDRCPYYMESIEDAKTVDANFNKGGFTFTYNANFPHQTFIIMEDTERYCRGIVFSLGDL